jgi:hypothetical protein
MNELKKIDPKQWKLTDFGLTIGDNEERELLPIQRELLRIKKSYDQLYTVNKLDSKKCYIWCKTKDKRYN